MNSTTQPGEALHHLTTLLHTRFRVPLALLLPDATFESFKLDSLDIEEIRMTICDAYGFDLWRDAYDPQTTLGRAADALNRGEDL